MQPVVFDRLTEYVPLELLQQYFLIVTNLKHVNLYCHILYN